MKIFGELKLNKKQAVFVITILISLGLVLISYETFNMSPPLLPGYPGDAFYPRLVIGFTAIWCIVILARGWRSEHQENAELRSSSEFSFHAGEFLSVTIAVLAYALLLKPLGFEISTFLFLIFLALSEDAKRRRKRPHVEHHTQHRHNTLAVGHIRFWPQGTAPS